MNSETGKNYCKGFFYLFCLYFRILDDLSVCGLAMLFRKCNLREKIETGDVFYRDIKLSGQEEARVVDICDDEQGIPHVRFERTLFGSGYKDPQGVRVLALDIFAREFHVTN